MYYNKLTNQETRYKTKNEKEQLLTILYININNTI